MSATMQEITGLLKKYWMPLFIAASVLYVAYYIHNQLDRIGDSISLSPLPLVGSAVLQLMFWIVSSYLWSMALFTVSSKKVSLIDSFFQLCLVNLGKYIPGKIWGMVARGSHLKQHHDIDVGRIIQATYIEQIYLLGSGVVIASLVAAAIGSNPVLWAMAPVISLAMIVAMIYQKPLTILTRLMHRLGKSDPVCELDNFNLPVMRLLFMFLMYVVVWLLLSMVMYGLYLSLFQAEITSQMAAVMVLSCVAGMSAGFVAVFSPGGVGVREAVSGAILAAYIPVDDAILLVLIFRIWLAVLELIVGGTLYLRSRNQGL